MAITSEKVTQFILGQFGPRLSEFINDLIEKKPDMSDSDRVCEISEYTEHVLIYEDLSNFNEGFVSNLVNEAINSGLIDYPHILNYLREDKA